MVASLLSSQSLYINALVELYSFLLIMCIVLKRILCETRVRQQSCLLTISWLHLNKEINKIYIKTFKKLKKLKRFCQLHLQNCHQHNHKRRRKKWLDTSSKRSTGSQHYSSQKHNVCLVKPAIYARVPRSYSPRSTLTVTRLDPRSLTSTQTDPERSTVQLCPSRRQHLSACMQRPRGAGFCERKTSVQVCATVSFDSWTDRTPR